MERILQPEEIKKNLADIGFQEDSPPSFHIWERVWCRLKGDHMWIPILSYELDTGKVYEDGRICERCMKEMG